MSGTTTVGDLKKQLEDVPDSMRVKVLDVDNQAWSILRADTGMLESGEQVFIISRYVRGYGNVIDEA